MTARAVTFESPGVVGFESVELPVIEHGEMLIEVEASAVSPGTELRCLAGLQPNSVAFPFIPGYALCGTIISLARGNADGSDYKADGLAVGTRVVAGGTVRASVNRQWGGHISHAIAKIENVVIVPEGCKPQSAALSKLVAIALRGVNVANPKFGDKVVVVGLGPIGLLAARLYGVRGASVLGIDREAARVDLAVRGGLKAVVASSPLQSLVHAHFGRGADIVVDATGSSDSLRDSVLCARDLPWGENRGDGAKLVVQGSYPDMFSVPYQTAFERELSLHIPRDCTRGDLQHAVHLVANGFCAVDDMISWMGDPHHALDAYNLLRGNPSAMTAVFDWRTEAAPH